MHFSKLLFLISIFLSFNVSAESEEIRREVNEFLSSYTKDLVGHKKSELVDRFDPRGYYKLGNGIKRLYSFEDVREWLTNRWAGPESLSFRDVSIEVLSPSAALVAAIMEWGNENGSKEIYSYTGLLIKHEGKWRIRLEDESAKPE